LLPLGVVAQAVGIAAFPTFSELAAQGKMDQVRSVLISTLRGVLFLALPASAGLLVLRVPIIRLLFEKDEFTAASTASVAWALAFYAVGLAGHAVLEIIVRAFYAMHDTRTPVIVGSVAMALNVVLSIGLSALFSAVGSPSVAHGGLALANSLATFFESLWLLWLLRKRLGGINGHQLLSALFKSGLATIAMGLVLWFWLRIWPNGPLLGVTGIGIGLGAIVYLAFAFILRMEELDMLKRALRRHSV
ncbi:MAG: polysaccharide biosynthesis C-terminal domain-containing protein, partial [Anaerolineales bacterium]|nr:polysaccharide biosynthesis C-terminal domain-containing protein [Anaerolineales bacterium]